MSVDFEPHETWVVRMKATYPKVLGPPHPWPMLEFAINPGWRKIVEEIASKLERLPSPPKAIQIKEKFGSLRFYVTGINEEIDTIIGAGTIISRETCEMCGAPGTEHNDKGWLRTVCVEHAR